MSTTAQTVVLSILLLSGSVWVGGFVAIAVVARTASRTLEPAQRIAFFRTLGRTYLKVGTAALLIAYLSGIALLWNHDWDGPLIATVVVAVLLLVALAVGVKQARHMTRLRKSALTNPEGDLAVAVRQGSSAAVILRSAIGVLSLALIVLGASLAA